MGFIERELERVQSALHAGELAREVYCQLYAVQQALAWSIEPTGFKAPYDTVAEGRVFSSPPATESNPAPAAEDFGG